MADATPKQQCPDCGYIYEQSRGEPHQGYPAGTPFAALPDQFNCPDCAIRDKVDFVPVADQKQGVR
jgi:alkane 1-monooxygenase